MTSLVTQLAITHLVLNSEMEGSPVSQYKQEDCVEMRLSDASMPMLPSLLAQMDISSLEVDFRPELADFPSLVNADRAF